MNALLVMLTIRLFCLGCVVAGHLLDFTPATSLPSCSSVTLFCPPDIFKAVLACHSVKGLKGALSEPILPLWHHMLTISAWCKPVLCWQMPPCLLMRHETNSQATSQYFPLAAVIFSSPREIMLGFWHMHARQIFLKTLCLFTALFCLLLLLPHTTHRLWKERRASD